MVPPMSQASTGHARDAAVVAAAAIHEASEAELGRWDAGTVDVPGGDVFQSRAFGEYRARRGWRPRFLVFDDGFRVLALERAWPWIGGAGAYLPRGPVAAGESPVTTADRLRAVADWLAAHGADVVASDAEIPARTGYSKLLVERGFQPIEEIQVARHRLGIPLGTDEAAQFALIDSKTRQRIRSAERRGARIRRYDARPGAPAPEFELAPPEGLAAAALEPVMRAFHEVFDTTAGRRGFQSTLMGADAFADWSVHAIGAGLAVYLEVRSPDDRMLGGAFFHRHGGRLTYAYAADRFEQRHEFPGVVHLLLWRAIQLAIREGDHELDLGGVDVVGARRKPLPGEAMHGLLEFKEAFGGQWVEQAGNHEWVARPWRYALGRVLAGLVRRRRNR
jgi:hypothetical protein